MTNAGEAAEPRVGLAARALRAHGAGGVVDARSDLRRNGLRQAPPAP